MIDHLSLPAAHESFPISTPALQSASLDPAFRYFDISHARRLSSLLEPPNPSFSPSELAAIGLIGRINLYLIDRFLSSYPTGFSDLDIAILRQFNQESANLALAETLDIFPTSHTFSDPSKRNAYFFRSDENPEFRHAYYYSLILILVAEHNPAIKTRDGVFTDPLLPKSLPFAKLMKALQEFFNDQSEKSPRDISLVDLLLEPGRRHPESLFDQLVFISKYWEGYLDHSLLKELIIGLDQLKEEIIPGPFQKIDQNPLGDLGESGSPELDPINFSPDQDWMPNVVLQAKNIYVWLDQLSREYQRPINRLDQVPEEEFVKLAHRGINTLWLIGIWERSPASQRIKQLCGNPEATSSAYSLYDYSIAQTLGGDEAYRNLSSTASQYQIRLAADMVPNHMGIDSRWISEQPDYFLSLDSPPFPSYSFNGPDLSSNPDHSIFLEDHYYDQSDAAVVFMRRDNRTGSTRYIYHGNDGTSMPWNDTAQLDYFNPEVREAITQTILDVARKFSVIRFDAAMTLSKKHYQRLWFPPPGTGGAIPTRSAFSLSKDEFDSRMPAEFWRELVDRVTEEVPDTLLLAEAFWMMEGYFVRTLGMHRVYNSAFMHMLRDEDNTKYRKLIIDTLEFDPQIMKRYVNFMNNPDEETALSQFGSGGKYFGTCLVMATLPGLPMFGHGQIEGLAEKYGMEYQKAYYNETPDPAFVDRHEREIFPLLHRRYLFSEVYNFYLFGLHRQDGTIDADVLSYSNRAYGENALIIFHNKWGDTRGWLSHSAPVNGKSTNLVTALGLSDNGDYITFTDRITGLEYIRSLKDLQSYGLFLELGAYQYHAFMDFKTVSDTDGSLTSLDQTLNGAGTLSLHNRKLEIKCSPLIDPIRQLLAEKSQIVLSTKNSDALSTDTKELISSTGDSFFSLLPTIFPEIKIDLENSFQRYTKRIHSVISLISDTQFSKLSPNASLLFSWSFLADLPGLIKEEALNIFLNLLIDRLAGSDQFPGPDRAFSFDELSLAFLLSSLLAEGSINPTLLGDLFFKEAMIRQYLNIHEHAGEEWFHKESMESMLKLAYTMVSIHHRIDFQLVDSHDNRDEEKAELDLITCFAESMAAIERSGYRVADFSALLRNLNCRKKA